MTIEVRYTATLPAGTTAVLAPGGITTPHGACTGCQIEGGAAREISEATTGTAAWAITPTPDRVTVTYRFDDSVTAPYPDAMFEHRPSRYTRFAEDLVAEAEDAAGDRTGLDRAAAIACATAERFTYGHPEEKFNDGLDEIPALGCGLTEGSCVEINTYFIAALRAAGIEAGYVTGFFFPEEKGDRCTDGHCWVVTRIDGETQEWDIAHHLKLGTRDIRPGLNPKPGQRAALFHSMGLSFPELGISDLKALIEPVAIVAGRAIPFDAPEIRLVRPARAAAE